MSIQDPIKRSTFRTATLENDNANVAAPACKFMSGFDEDRLDLIASFPPPFLRILTTWIWMLNPPWLTMPHLIFNLLLFLWTAPLCQERLAT